MQGMGFGGGLIALVVLAVNIAALWKLLERSGSPGWIALLGLLPILMPVLLWYVAFKRWPGDPAPGA